MDIDSEITPYRASIKRLYSSLEIIPTIQKDFKCKYYKCEHNSCSRPERTGDWPYIGVDYGKARISDKNIKILFVAMDRGEGKEHSEEQRFEEYQRVWREATCSPGNPHMCGVQLIMKELVKEDTKDPCIFANQFALTNAVKCGHVGKPSTPQMISNCSNHLLEEIKYLEPNLIITQGSFPAWSVTHCLNLSTPIHSFTGTKLKRIEIFKSEEWLVLTTPHPAARQIICIISSLFEAIEKVKEIIRDTSSPLI